uniref:Uncharacterized protein n=1 Tax=Heterorhabditis bacteriophora TaxID=37862 RepID=A0A1I7WU88_HETBA
MQRLISLSKILFIKNFINVDTIY